MPWREASLTLPLSGGEGCWGRLALVASLVCGMCGEELAGGGDWQEGARFGRQLWAGLLACIPDPGCPLWVGWAGPLFGEEWTWTTQLGRSALPSIPVCPSFGLPRLAFAGRKRVLPFQRPVDRTVQIWFGRCPVVFWRAGLAKALTARLQLAYDSQRVDLERV